MVIQAVLLTHKHKKTGAVTYSSFCGFRRGVRMGTKARDKAKHARADMEKTITMLGHEVAWTN